MKRILITGGSGFIGRNLKEYLSEKHNIFAPPHEKLDLLDYKKVEKYIKKNRIDVIIHSAIYGGSKKDTELKNIVQTNLRMFFNLARNSSYVEKIFFLSSGLEYDKNRPLINIKEDDFDVFVPADDYGLYKYICAKYIERSKNIYDLVLFGVYGKYEDYLYKYISNSIIKNLLGMPITIMQDVYIDYLYIDDFSKIINSLIAKKLKYKKYNVAAGKKISLFTIAKLINEISEFKSEIVVVKKGLNNEYTANTKRLTEELKRVKFTPPKTTISNLYQWYKTQINKINTSEIENDPFVKYIKEDKNIYKKIND